MPARVSADSPNPISTLGDWRAAWMAARDDPDGFWLDQARRRVQWRQEPTIGLNGSFHDIADGPLSWFGDGRLNLTETCLDRQVARHPDKTAIIWEADDPADGRNLTYRELHQAVCRAANGLERLGVRPGERVIIYMGMVWAPPSSRASWSATTTWPRLPSSASRTR